MGGLKIEYNSIFEEVYIMRAPDDHTVCIMFMNDQTMQEINSFGGDSIPLVTVRWKLRPKISA